VKKKAKPKRSKLKGILLVAGITLALLLVDFLVINKGKLPFSHSVEPAAPGYVGSTEIVNQPKETIVPGIVERTVDPSRQIPPQLTTEPMIGSSLGREVITPENAGQIVELKRWGDGTRRNLAWSPDGRQLAVSSSIGIYLYDTKTNKIDRYIDTGGWVDYVGYSPDGHTLASTSSGEIDLWNTDNWKLIYRFKLSNNTVKCISISNNGILASQLVDGLVNLWNIDEGKLIYSFISSRTGDNMEDCDFLPDGSSLIIGARDYPMEMWDVEKGTLVRTFEGDLNAYEVEFSDNGRYLASKSDETIIVRDPYTGEIYLSIENRTDVGEIRFSPDEHTLALTSFNSVELWDLDRNDLLLTIQDDSGINQLTFSPDGYTLATVSYNNNSVRLWNVSSGQQLTTLSENPYNLFNFAYSPDGKILATGFNEVILWNVDDNTMMKSLDLNPFVSTMGNIYGIQFSPSAGILAIGTYRGSLLLLDVASVKVLKIIESEDNFYPGNCLDFSPDGRILAVCTEEKGLRLWDIEQLLPLNRLEDQTADIKLASFSPDGSTLIGTTGSTIRNWDVTSGRLVYEFNGSDDDIRYIAFSPDGSILATVSQGEINLWEAATGNEFKVLIPGTPLAYQIAFSPDGRILAAGLRDGTVILWDITTGLANTLYGHTMNTSYLFFSPDGTYLISGSGDQTIRFWGIP
jgi:WD40 repeat protein